MKLLQPGHVRCCLECGKPVKTVQKVTSDNSAAKLTFDCEHVLLLQPDGTWYKTTKKQCP